MGLVFFESELTPLSKHLKNWLPQGCAYSLFFVNNVHNLKCKTELARKKGRLISDVKFALLKGFYFVFM